MISLSNIPGEITEFCARCAEGLPSLTEDNARIQCIRKEFPSLLRNTSLFARILADITSGAKYPDLGYATMFDNELLLYADPGRLFSLRLFLWDAGDYTPVHDHSSWGVIGPVSGTLEVINYRRDDPGSQAGQARLIEAERLLLEPGETAFTLPLNDGIHTIGNPTDEAMLSLSLYGSPLPRGYINGFDLATGYIYQIVAPKIKKKVLATKALIGLDKAAGEDAFKRVRAHHLDIMRSAAENPK
ncbi:MAG: hypothetical protein C4532_14465 [Candidatus Abyssobacteria bacterium SURF_17]|uniref:Cysteine dioxygenase n=1 Tax=Candidatus Abyssobacteria bacterium SURF_17 TaxID=2093361 RepID=A0A419EU31_9BACT|nr:MAG: hypothetical protein C4532_14465 [Candidatus Abyssubacteria bacterium SURF_17]